MAGPKNHGDAGLGKRRDDAHAQQGGQPNASGTTERDHGGKGSSRPDLRDGGDRNRTQMEGGMASTDGRGPGDERRGAAAPTVRSDSEGAVPDTGMDRDAGAGAAAGHDRGGTQASRNAQRAQQEAGGSAAGDTERGKKGGSR